MTESYRHTQIGFVIIIALSAAVALVGYLMSLYRFSWIPASVLFILVVCLFLFPSLTVTVGRNMVEARFGTGPIRWRFPLRDIVSCRAVRNSWYYGWGIRLTPHGWLLNVSGLQAVEIEMRSGKKYRIGTDEPWELEKAIQRTLESGL